MGTCCGTMAEDATGRKNAIVPGDINTIQMTNLVVAVASANTIKNDQLQNSGQSKARKDKFIRTGEADQINALVGAGSKVAAQLKQQELTTRVRQLWTMVRGAVKRGGFRILAEQRLVHAMNGDADSESDEDPLDNLGANSTFRDGDGSYWSTWLSSWCYERPRKHTMGPSKEAQKHMDEMGSKNGTTEFDSGLRDLERGLDALWNIASSVEDDGVGDVQRSLLDSRKSRGGADDTAFGAGSGSGRRIQRMRSASATSFAARQPHPEGLNHSHSGRIMRRGSATSFAGLTGGRGRAGTDGAGGSGALADIALAAENLAELIITEDDTPIAKVNTRRMAGDAMTILKRLSLTVPASQQNSRSFEDVRRGVADLRSRLVIVEKLRHPALKNRHRTRLEILVGGNQRTRLHPDVLTFGHITKERMYRFAQNIDRVLSGALREYTIMKVIRDTEEKELAEIAYLSKSTHHKLDTLGEHKEPTTAGPSQQLFGRSGRRSFYSEFRKHASPSQGDLNPVLETLGPETGAAAHGRLPGMDKICNLRYGHHAYEEKEKVVNDMFGDGVAQVPGDRQADFYPQSKPGLLPARNGSPRSESSHSDVDSESEVESIPTDWTESDDSGGLNEDSDDEEFLHRLRTTPGVAPSLKKKSTGARKSKATESPLPVAAFLRSCRHQAVVHIPDSPITVPQSGGSRNEKEDHRHHRRHRRRPPRSGEGSVGGGIGKFTRPEKKEKERRRKGDEVDRLLGGTPSTSELVPEPLLIRRKVNNTLSLQHYGIGDRLGKALADGLSVGLPHLRHINLTDNRLKDETVADLVAAISDAPTGVDGHLQTLCLSRNTMGAKAAEKMSLFLDKHLGLRRLELNGMEIGNKEIIAFAEKIEVCSTLEIIELAHNNIKGPGIEVLAKHLLPKSKANQSALYSVDLSWNRIGVAGAIALGAVLVDNTHLQQLALNSCALGPSGVEHLVECLGRNESLVTLNLTSNGITEVACPAICDAIEDNGGALSELLLDENPLGGKGLRAILRLVTLHDHDREIVASSTGLIFGKAGTARRVSIHEPAREQVPQGSDGINKVRRSLSIMPSASIATDETRALQLSIASCNVPMASTGDLDIGGIAEGGIAKVISLAKELKGHRHFFDPAVPAGKYLLDLDKSPRDRATARAIYRAANKTPGVVQLVVQVNGEPPKTLFRDEVDDGDGDTAKMSIKSWVEAGTSHPWALPTSGSLAVDMVVQKMRPMMAQAQNDAGIERLLKFIYGNDANMRWRESMLFLSCIDTFFTSPQVRRILECISNGAEKTRALTWLLPRTCDDEVILSHWHPDEASLTRRSFEKRMMRIDQTHGVFNPQNPSGRYIFHLWDSADHVAFEEVIQASIEEGNRARQTRRRKPADTSQAQSRSCLRGGYYMGFGEIFVERLQPTPHHGQVVMDYVGTVRPPKGSKPMSDKDFQQMLRELHLNPGNPVRHFHTHPSERKLQSSLATDKEQKQAVINAADGLEGIVDDATDETAESRVLDEQKKDATLNKGMGKKKSMRGGSSFGGNILAKAALQRALHKLGRRMAFRRVHENGVCALRDYLAEHKVR